MTARWGPILLLIVAGAAWGATQPLSKVAVSDGHGPFGIIFWNQAIAAIVLTILCYIRGKGLPTEPGQWAFCLLIALIGAVLPGISAYSAAVHLPAGLLSILLSSIPMIAFPIALALGNERFQPRRLIGLALGLCAVMLLVIPKESFSGAAPALWIMIALISSVFYAAEGNIVAKWGTRGLGPVQLLAGASILGALTSAPLALVSGQWIDPTERLAAPELAIAISAILHATAYTIYVALVRGAGAVFAVQVSYLVTLFGVLWAMLFLGERYGLAFWGAFALMLTGMALVQPRPTPRDEVPA